MFLRCQEQWRRRYLDGEKIPPGIAAHVGSGVHKAIEVDLVQKIETGEDIPEDIVEDAAATGYEECVRDGVYLTRDEAPAASELLGYGKDSAVRMARHWRRNVAEQVAPAVVEKRYSIEWPGVDVQMVGVIDCADTDAYVRDWKTASRRWARGREDNELQPTIYREIYRRVEGREPAGLVFNLIVDLKGGVQDEERITERTDQDTALVSRIAGNMLRQIEAGVFMPATPGAWNCAEKWCGFWSTCKYVSDRIRRLPNV